MPGDMTSPSSLESFPVLLSPHACRSCSKPGEEHDYTCKRGTSDQQVENTHSEESSGIDKPGLLPQLLGQNSVRESEGAAQVSYQPTQPEQSSISFKWVPYDSVDSERLGKSATVRHGYVEFSYRSVICQAHNFQGAFPNGCPPAPPFSRVGCRARKQSQSLVWQNTSLISVERGVFLEPPRRLFQILRRDCWYTACPIPTRRKTLARPC